MIRKITKHGPTTLITSLPQEWVKRFNLVKGDEINVEVKEDKLILSPIKRVEVVKKVTIDLREFDENIVNFILPIPHKIGYDEVEILFVNPKIAKKCQQRINEMLVGYEIIEQSANRILIKNISSSFEEQYENLLKRLFLVTITFANELLQQLSKNQDFSELMNLEQTINKISNLCERILNTELYRDKKNFHYLIAWNLESIGDNYRDILEYCMKSKISLDKEVLDFFSQINELLKDYFQLHYKFDLKKIGDIKNVQKNVNKNINFYLLKTRNKQEIFVLIGLFGINQRITDALGSTAALNY